MDVINFPKTLSVDDILYLWLYLNCSAHASLNDLF